MENGKMLQPVWLEALRSLEPRDAAELIDERVIEVEECERHLYVELGLLLIEMERRELYKHLPDPKCDVCGAYAEWAAGHCLVCRALQANFRSFDRWLIVRAPVARSTGYKAKGTVEAGLEAGLSIERMMRINRGNLDEIATLSPELRTDERVLEAAETKTHDEFLAKLEQDHPAQHKESKRQMLLKPTRTARQIIDSTILAAEMLHDLPCREAAIEYVCASWLNAQCELEEFRGCSNLEAYQRRQSEAA